MNKIVVTELGVWKLRDHLGAKRSPTIRTTTWTKAIPLTIQTAEIERQISDEDIRSVRNEKQEQVPGINNNNIPILMASFWSI